MKINNLNSIHKIIIFLCFFILGVTYSQDKKPKAKTLLGKTVKPTSINPQNGKIRCATVEYEEYLQKKNPKRRTNTEFETWLAPLVKKQKTMKTSSQSSGIVTIPVVVHVIYSGQAIGVAPNITDAQIQSQITVLNQDFRKMAGTPGDNNNPVGADTQIQFALAQVDPKGNPTNGIDRVSFCQDSWSMDEMNATVKPSTIWDPTQYFNMWTVQLSEGDLLGFAQFPDGSGLADLNPSGFDASTDGVVGLYNIFGSETYDDGTFLLQAPYNKGRSMTHEVGHWLGLNHIWGDDTCGNDFCDDTPVHHNENFKCPSILSCNSKTVKEMVENYMDYTDDTCMNIFTNDQKTRITTVINNAVRRASLKTSTKNSPIPLFANDAELKLETSCDVATCGVSSNTTIKKILLYNRGTSNLTSATINYTINGGSTNTYKWTGNLATHQLEIISLTVNATTNGTISANIASANGVTDQRSTNNSASGTYIIPTTAPNYSFTNYVFRLQLDLWGSETTWDLKDSSGKVLYSGGPYADKENLPLPNLITNNWTLASGKCYTLTIRDSQGDGICCGEGGNGYFDLKSTSGTVIASGSSFSAVSSSTFTIGTLGTDQFELSSDIYLHPNPTKEILNIQIPSYFGLPDSYTISNALGQNCSKKEISKESDLIIDTSNLSNGVYFITIIKQDQKRTLKFIKE